MTSMETLYRKWVALLDRLRGFFLLAVRLYWGWGFMQAGWGKVSHLSRVAEYFQSLGIPFPQANAALAGSTEMAGGLLLLLGLGARLVPVPLLFVLGVAYATAEKEALQALWSDPDKFTAATPFLFAFACLVVLFCGAGPWSADTWIACRKKSGE